MIVKLIIIIVIIFIFYFSIFYVMEKFSGNYINTNEISPDYYNKLYSSIPYDIIVKNDNMNIYDYGNDELNIKFIKVFNINYKKEIKYIEGIEWIKGGSYDYQSIIKEFLNILNTYSTFRLKVYDDKFQIIKHNLNMNNLNRN